MKEKFVEAFPKDEKENEEREKLPATVFTIRFNKEALAGERDRVAPEGLEAFDNILKLPETISFPRETTVIIGPNGSGKSTLLSLFDMMGEFAGLHYMRNEREPETSFAEIRNEELNEISRTGRFKGLAKTETRKLGIAPIFAKHTEITEGSENIENTYIYRIPEKAGRVWALEEAEEMGRWETRNTYDSKGNLISGVYFQEGEVNPEILGSTQQIIDKDMKDYLKGRLSSRQTYSSKPKQKLILLDEPTESSDLKRSLGYLRELDEMNAKHGNCASFIIATNSPIFALHRNIPRIDLEHPERGVHYLRDYSIDEEVREGLKDMGYASIEEQANKES